MLLTLSQLGLAALALGPPSQEPAAVAEVFPASTALAEGVSPESLAGLSALVQTLVDEEEIVGAELLVLKNGHSILHEAYGWSDREAELPLRTGSVFCVRSMTKPLIGAAILMLIDDDALELDDRVAEYLPSFEAESTRDITVEHLLTHTSGLPMSLLLGKDLEELHASGGIRAVADLGSGHALGFAPGTRFNYSDQGTDTLTALIEVASGMPAAEFVRTRVLDPLGMRNTVCVMTTDSPLRERALPKYAGTRGEWKRFWSPDDPPLFPFFLGSQGLYSTLEDYALFMEFWGRKGRGRTGLGGNERLLGSRFVKRALEPRSFASGMPTGFPGLKADYGYLMQLWTGPGEEGEERGLVAFGHTGSDGTHAWAFPEENAMVLYFTQSRNNTTGLRVEEALGELFLGVPYDSNQAAPPFEDYLGYYWEGEGDRYRAIIRDGDDLALEILGQGVVPLTYVGEDAWKFRPNPAIVLAFERSEAGDVTGYRIGDHQEYRFEPAQELPSADELAERVAQTHRIDLLEGLGPLRMTSKLNMEKLGIEGEITTLLAWPDCYRVDTTVAGNFEHTVFDGTRVRYASSTEPAATLEGPRAEEARLESLFVRFGDPRRWNPLIEVIQKITSPAGEEVFLVRLGDTSAPARTLYVDWESGRIFREEGLVHVENMGRIGQRLTFGDFRDVSGALLPFRTELVLANPLIGPIVTTTTDYELGVEVSAATFELQEE
jgi:CubicO group peptidase (beta-lactamase class C family)